MLITVSSIGIWLAVKLPAAVFIARTVVLISPRTEALLARKLISLAEAAVFDPSDTIVPRFGRLSAAIAPQSTMDMRIDGVAAASS